MEDSKPQVLKDLEEKVEKKQLEKKQLEKKIITSSQEKQEYIDQIEMKVDMKDVVMIEKTTYAFNLPSDNNEITYTIPEILESDIKQLYKWKIIDDSIADAAIRAAQATLETIAIALHEAENEDETAIEELKNEREKNIQFLASMQISARKDAKTVKESGSLMNLVFSLLNVYVVTELVENDDKLKDVKDCAKPGIVDAKKDEIFEKGLFASLYETSFNKKYTRLSESFFGKACCDKVSSNIVKIKEITKRNDVVSNLMSFSHFTKNLFNFVEELVKKNYSSDKIIKFDKASNLKRAFLKNEDEYTKLYNEIIEVQKRITKNVTSKDTEIYGGGLVLTGENLIKETKKIDKILQKHVNEDGQIVNPYAKKIFPLVIKNTIYSNAIDAVLAYYNAIETPDAIEKFFNNMIHIGVGFNIIETLTQINIKCFSHTKDNVLSSYILHALISELTASLLVLLECDIEKQTPIEFIADIMATNVLKTDGTFYKKYNVDIAAEIVIKTALEQILNTYKTFEKNTKITDIKDIGTYNEIATMELKKTKKKSSKKTKKIKGK